jgi:hypothetical protein
MAVKKSNEMLEEIHLTQKAFGIFLDFEYQK